jgi:hypothetical protein
MLCRELTTCLWASAEDDLQFVMEHKQVMGCIRLLLSRLMLINSVFEHGKHCCEQQYQHPDTNADLVFTVQNQHQMLEVAFAQPDLSYCFPLLAVINSLNSCIGVINCMLICGGEGQSEEQDYFGPGDSAILNSLMMIGEQLDLIIHNTDTAQDKSFRIK